MPIKTLGSLGKIRVGRVTGNTHIFFFGLRFNNFAKYSTPVYHDFNTSNYVPAISSQSERKLQLCNTSHLTSFLKRCHNLRAKTRNCTKSIVLNMMWDGYGLYGKFYMGPRWGPYLTHIEHPCGPNMEPYGEPLLDQYRNPFGTNMGPTCFACWDWNSTLQPPPPYPPLSSDPTSHFTPFLLHHYPPHFTCITTVPELHQG